MLVIKLGAEMRAAQRAYFHTRSQANLAAAKALETRFDEAVASVTANPIDLLTFNRGDQQ